MSRPEGIAIDGESGFAKVICFTVAGQELAAPIRAVKETIRFRPLTRVFLTPPLVAGLINLRGEVVAVLDLAELLGLPSAGRRREDPDAAILILRATSTEGGRAGERAAAGLLVDALHGARDVPLGELRPAPATLDAEAAAYLRGVVTISDEHGAPRPLALLDPERVLDTERLRPFRRRAGVA
ncbi:MAG TPA: chemotaxis protein CheW [Polyangia bacterium]